MSTHLPKTSLPKKIKKKVKCQASAQQLAELALERADEGSSLSNAVKAVCEGHSINPEVVRVTAYRLKRKKEAAESIDKRSKLSEEQEQIVIGFISAFDGASIPLNGVRLRKAIQGAFQVDLSPTWVTRFLRRHADQLSRREVKGIQSRRVKAVTPGTIQLWLDRLEEFLQKHYFPPHAILNCDETRLIPPRTKPRIVTRNASKKNNREMRIFSLGTLIPFISAEGNVEISYYIVKDSQEQSFSNVIPREDRRRGSWKRKYAMTKSGYVNKAVFQEMLLDFRDHWSARYPGLHCLIFMDNCSSHRSDSTELDDSFMLSMASQGIWIYYLPPNTTSWLQPLDNAAFGLFKITLGRRREEICFAAALLHNQDGALDLQDAVDAETRAFTPRVIKKSWRSTGLSTASKPGMVDRAKVMKLASQNYGKHTEVNETISNATTALTLALIEKTPTPNERIHHTLPVTAGRFYNADELLAIHHSQQAALAEKKASKDRKAAEAKAAKDARKQQKLEQAIEKDRQKQANLETRLVQKRIREEKKQEEEQRKKTERESRQCRNCGKINLGGKDWCSCTKGCGYLICKTCSAATSLLKKHQQRCRVRRRRTS